MSKIEQPLSTPPRRRYWTAEQKLALIEETQLPGETVSSVARREINYGMIF